MKISKNTYKSLCFYYSNIAFFLENDLYLLNNDKDFDNIASIEP